VRGSSSVAWFRRSISKHVEKKTLFFQRGFVGNVYAFFRQKKTRQVAHRGEAWRV
jgi:hypothetical protein